MKRRNILAIVGGAVIGAFLGRSTPTEAASMPQTPIVVDTEWFEWVGKSGKVDGVIQRDVWRSMHDKSPL